MSASVMRAEDSAPAASMLSTDKPEALLDLGGREAGRGREGGAGIDEVAVMLGEAEHRAVVPGHAPAIGHGGGAAREVRRQGGGRVFMVRAPLLPCEREKVASRSEVG